MIFLPEMTRPSSADRTTQQTGWSCPVMTALGVGWWLSTPPEDEPPPEPPPPSPTIDWWRALQCQRRTVQSSDPEMEHLFRIEQVQSFVKNSFKKYYIFKQKNSEQSK